MREINKIIVHCSASDNPAHDNIDTIRQWHVERGFHGIGYHYFIDSQGKVFDGRPLEDKGAHCEGQNFDSIGICLHGEHAFNDRQFKALYRIVNNLCDAFSLTLKDVFSHNHFNNKKTCPNFAVGAILERINEENRKETII